MPENPAAGDLALLAFLYASGELGPDEADSFERRLGSDQEARDALVQAVQASPDPAYRERVRARLRPVWWRRWLSRGTYRGHPLLWGTLGAATAAAVVLSLFVGREEPVRIVEVPVILPGEVLVAAPPEDQREGAVEVSADAVGDMANVWADLSNPDHLTQALDEEQKRRTRHDDWRQFRRTMQQMVIED